MAVKTFRYSLLSNLQENLCKLKKTRASNSVNVLRIDPCQQLISNLMKHYHPHTRRTFRDCDSVWVFHKIDSIQKSQG